MFKKIGPNQLRREWQYDVIDPNRYGRSSLVYSKNHYTKVYDLGEEQWKTKQKNVDKNIVLLDKIDWAKKINDKKNNLKETFL